MEARFHQIARIFRERKYQVILLSLIMVFVLLDMVYGSTMINLTIDGKTKTVHTRARTVAAVLRENGVTVKAFDKVVPKLSYRIKQGMTVTVRHAVPVTVKLNNQEIAMMSTASTVGGILRDMRLQTKPADKVYPNKDEKVKAGMKVEVTLVTSEYEVAKVPVAYQTVTKEDPNLDYGQKVTVTQGKPGLLLRVTKIVLQGGQPVSKQIKLESTLSPPVNEVMAIGTKRKIARVVEPTINVSRGEARSPVGRVLVMLATAYAPVPAEGGSLTATGMRAQRGVVAVDPRVIPLGTRLYVDGYGEAIAADTGGAIKGNRIDLCFNTPGECNEFGVRTVKVTILN